MNKWVKIATLLYTSTLMSLFMLVVMLISISTTFVMFIFVSETRSGLGSVGSKLFYDGVETF
jgi:hypothetical protein